MLDGTIVQYGQPKLEILEYSLSLKYLSSSAVRVDDKSLFYSIRFEFGFHDILTATAANILFQVRLSVTVIPNLIWDPDEYTL